MLRKFDFWTLVMLGTWGILLLLLFIGVHASYNSKTNRV